IRLYFAKEIATSKKFYSVAAYKIMIGKVKIDVRRRHFSVSHFNLCIQIICSLSWHGSGTSYSAYTFYKLQFIFKSIQVLYDCGISIGWQDQCSILVKA